MDSDGRSGGLLMDWKDSCKVSSCSFSRHYIDVMIVDDKEGNMWRCTGFSGAPEERCREESWDLMRVE